MIKLTDKDGPSVWINPAAIIFFNLRSCGKFTFVSMDNEYLYFDVQETPEEIIALIEEHNAKLANKTV